MMPIKKRAPAQATAKAGKKAVANRNLATAVSPNRPTRHRASEPREFKTSMLTLRVREGIKTEATAVLAKAGISLPEAIRVFLGRVVSENGLPFDLHVPNAETRAALRDSEVTSRSYFASAEEMIDDLAKGGR